MRTLVLGGVKSGKSRFAERLAATAAGPVTYLATARGNDAGMRTRIAAHRARRPAYWSTVEVAADLATELDRHDTPDGCQLVDCLTLWLTGLIDEPGRIAQRRDDLCAFLPRARGRVILVSNEVGWGVVPMGELSRRFVDEAGRLHQAVAAVCDRVVLVVAGLPLTLKGVPDERG